MSYIINDTILQVYSSSGLIGTFLSYLHVHENFKKERKSHKKIMNSERGRLLVLLDFSLTVKVATLIFISGGGSAIPSANEG